MIDEDRSNWTLDQLADEVIEACELPMGCRGTIIAALGDAKAQGRAEVDAYAVQRDEALKRVMVGGNHLAHVLIGWLGPDFAYRYPPTLDHDTARERMSDEAGYNAYDVWCCWATIMDARAAPRDELQERLAQVAGVPCRFCMGAGSADGPCPQCGKPTTPLGVGVHTEPPESRADFYAYINRTPVLMSLLYDLDLMPEQVEENSDEEARMFKIADHWFAHEAETAETMDHLRVENDDYAKANAALNAALASTPNARTEP